MLPHSLPLHTITDLTSWSSMNNSDPAYRHVWFSSQSFFKKSELVANILRIKRFHHKKIIDPASPENQSCGNTGPTWSLDSNWKGLRSTWHAPSCLQQPTPLPTDLHLAHLVHSVQLSPGNVRVSKPRCNLDPIL